jgi:putative ABC transport system ATP-binding protein
LVKSIFIVQPFQPVPPPLGSPGGSVQTQKNPPGGGLLGRSVRRTNLLCAQLHLPGASRMMMVVHVVNPNEHDVRDYRARPFEVNGRPHRRIIGSAMSQPSPGAPVFVAQALRKVYEMGEVTVEALRGVDFDLYAGEFIVLLGPSGSGKSTLLNILGGLDVPTSGSVVYRDRTLTTADDAALTEYRRSHVGFVFQFYNLIPSLTARENVALVTELSAGSMRPEEALDLVGLGARLDHFPAQLSGGEQQRVAIARAIAKRPDVLLCDEPTGALDITTGAVVLDAITRVNHDLGTSTVVITHNAAIAGLADRVVRLADGQVSSIERNSRKQTVQELQW